MGKICWKEEFSVGVEICDKQHRRIFEIISKLDGRTGSPQDIKLVCEILAEMVNYSREHFTEEEKLMRQYDYPQFESQKKQHDYFIKATGELSLSLKESRHKTADEIAEFLGLWWSSHILKSDMKYKEFFAIKISPAANYAI